ncbi:MAG: hypothetical protein KC503_29040 [Myxococcales bacterium]|nr:hypothetical protein [Myxococcales bacterium]
MYRKEVNEQSPLRILEGSIHGGLGAGNLGILAARAGVGKTACLVQIGLDDLMRERPVLHLALKQTVEHVQSWYDSLFEDLALRTDLAERERVHTIVLKHRMISAFGESELAPNKLAKTGEMLREHLGFKPAAILVDGHNWEARSAVENAAIVGAFKAYAEQVGAELWMTAQTHRRMTGEHPMRLPHPISSIAELVDVCLFLEPHEDVITVRLLKDHDNETPADTKLRLHADTLRLTAEGDEHGTPRMHASAYTLLSGGAKGSEACFGVLAERYGLTEETFTFSGRSVERTRGLIELTDAELKRGAVSEVYLQQHMHRTYPDTRLFRRMLQTIWHQVNTAGEVFTVGLILDDNTVKGGTGWAAMLGRHWNKPVHVFDQEKRQWFRWRHDGWVAEDAPIIRSRRFCGTGTRLLSEAGKQAIEALYERSFGPSPLHVVGS